MFTNNLFENVPNDRLLAFDHFAGLFDGGGVSILFKLVVDKRLKELKRHFLRQTALVQLKLRAHDDNRTSRIIDTLTEQILPETSLLTFQSTGQRLERAIVRTTKHTAAASVVE